MRVAVPPGRTADPGGPGYQRARRGPPSRLVESLQALREGRDDDQVFLKGDAAISYAQFINVVDLLYQGGIRHVGLVTERIGAE